MPLSPKAVRTSTFSSYDNRIIAARGPPRFWPEGKLAEAHLASSALFELLFKFTARLSLAERGQFCRIVVVRCNDQVPSPLLYLRKS
jgi:hypothetical protein